MKTKSRKLLSTLLAFALIFGLLATMPMTASAAEPIQVTENPVGAIYNLGDTAVPLKATFSWPDAYSGSIDSKDPITLQWYWTLDPLVMNEQNGAGIVNIPYSRPLEINTEHTPDTSTVGVKYYYAVVTYTAITLTGSVSQAKARTNPARVEVKAPEAPKYDITVKKVDDKGNPLPGAGIQLTHPDGAVSAVMTDGDGIAVFSVSEGTYIISEAMAPAGFKKTDKTYEVRVSATGVSVTNPNTDYPDYPITFVNVPDTGNENKMTAVTVLKKDDKGSPLAGATIRLEGLNESGIPRVYDIVTDNKGEAVFAVEYGTYEISERAAPQGYNATDETYKIVVSASGVFIQNPPNNNVPYTPVTFVNKEIPTLNKDDHFAFMQGYPDGTFGQERNMTRAEAVVMFSRLLSKKMDESTNYYKSEYYPDVPSSAWYANQVCFMYYKGVLANYSRDGNFRPNEPVTRAEFATLAAHFDNLVLTDTNKFSDVPDSHWAVKFINSAEAKGWIAGYPDGTFKPEANITRAEVVTLVGRMLDRYADKEYLATNAGSLPRNYSDLSTTHWAYYAIMEASIGHDYTKDSAGEHWTAVYQ